MTNGTEFFFIDYCKEWEKIAETSKTKEKTEIIENNINKFGFSWLTLGKYSHEYNLENLNFSKQRIISFLESYFNVPNEFIEKHLIDLKDLGELSQSLIYDDSDKIGYLTIQEVISFLRVISKKNEIEDKNKLLKILFDACNSLEIKYITRLILQDMQIGVKENLILKAFANRFNKTIEDVKYLFFITNDFRVLHELLEKNVNPSNVQLTPGIPIKPMLSHKLKNIPNEPHYYEIKYDGVRIQIHNIIKQTGLQEIKIFTRNLEDVTDSLPEIEALFIGWDKEFIIEAELLAFKDNGNPAPFKNVMTRLKRKKDSYELASKNPLMIKIFDILFFESNLIRESFEFRTKFLSKIFPEDFLSTFIYSADFNEINEFFEDVISKGFEGLMVKNPNEKYYLGQRKNAVNKWKPKFHELDAVVIAAEYGSGKNHDKISILHLGLQIPGKSLGNTGILLEPIGKVASGMKDEDLEELTELHNHKALIDKVVEVAFAEVTKTENNEFRMRFPVFKGIRHDKNVNDANLKLDLEEIYNKQINL